MKFLSFPGGSDGKEPACNAGDLSSIPGLGRPPEEGNGNPLWYSSLENPVDRGAWQATVHGVTESWTRLSDFHFTSCWQLGYHDPFCPDHYLHLCQRTGSRWGPPAARRVSQMAAVSAFPQSASSLTPLCLT